MEAGAQVPSEGKFESGGASARTRGLGTPTCARTCLSSYVRAWTKVGRKLGEDEDNQSSWQPKVARLSVDDVAAHLHSEQLANPMPGPSAMPLRSRTTPTTAASLALRVVLQGGNGHGVMSDAPPEPLTALHAVASPVAGSPLAVRVEESPAVAMGQPILQEREQGVNVPVEPATALPAQQATAIQVEPPGMVDELPALPPRHPLASQVTELPIRPIEEKETVASVPQDGRPDHHIDQSPASARKALLLALTSESSGIVEEAQWSAMDGATAQAGSLQEKHATGGGERERDDACEWSDAAVYQGLVVSRRLRRSGWKVLIANAIGHGLQCFGNKAGERNVPYIEAHQLSPALRSRYYSALPRLFSRRNSPQTCPSFRCESYRRPRGLSHVCFLLDAMRVALPSNWRSLLERDGSTEASDQVVPPTRQSEPGPAVGTSRGGMGGSRPLDDEAPENREKQAGVDDSSRPRRRQQEPPALKWSDSAVYVEILRDRRQGGMAWKKLIEAAVGEGGVLEKPWGRSRLRVVMHPRGMNEEAQRAYFPAFTKLAALRGSSVSRKRRTRLPQGFREIFFMLDAMDVTLPQNWLDVMQCPDPLLPSGLPRRQRKDEALSLRKGRREGRISERRKTQEHNGKGPMKGRKRKGVGLKEQARSIRYEDKEVRAKEHESSGGRKATCQDWTEREIRLEIFKSRRTGGSGWKVLLEEVLGPVRLENRGATSKILTVTQPEAMRVELKGRYHEAVKKLLEWKAGKGLNKQPPRTRGIGDLLFVLQHMKVPVPRNWREVLQGKSLHVATRFPGAGQKTWSSKEFMKEFRRGKRRGSGWKTLLESALGPVGIKSWHSSQVVLTNRSKMKPELLDDFYAAVHELRRWRVEKGKVPGPPTPRGIVEIFMVLDAMGVPLPPNWRETLGFEDGTRSRECNQGSWCSEGRVPVEPQLAGEEALPRDLAAVVQATWAEAKSLIQRGRKEMDATLQSVRNAATQGIKRSSERIEKLARCELAKCRSVSPIEKVPLQEPPAEDGKLPLALFPREMIHSLAEGMGRGAFLKSLIEVGEETDRELRHWSEEAGYEIGPGLVDKVANLEAVLRQSVASLAAEIEDFK